MSEAHSSSSTKNNKPAVEYDTSSESSTEFLGPDRANEQINDTNQYEQFYREKNEGLLKESGQRRVSYPISAESMEYLQFEKALPEILNCLKKQGVPWQSIDCLGRSSEGTAEKILSTVVISLTTLEWNSGDTSLQDVERDIQSAGQLRLPVEFVKGGFVTESHFGFKELSNPLVCGASCGNVEAKTRSGTIGGFVVIDGDPDSTAIYAVSNHHVFLPDRTAKVTWATSDKLAENLQVVELVEELMKLRGLESQEEAIAQLDQLWSSLDDIRPESAENMRLKLNNIIPGWLPARLPARERHDINGSKKVVFLYWRVLFQRLNTLKSQWARPSISEGIYDDILQELYVQDKEVIHKDILRALYEQDHQDMEGIHDDVFQKLYDENKAWRERHLVLSRDENTKNTKKTILEVVWSFWFNEGAHLTGPSKRWYIPDLEKRLWSTFYPTLMMLVNKHCGDFESFKELRFLRRLLHANRSKAYSRMIEHPSRPDRMNLVSRLRRELVESKTIQTTCTNGREKSEAEEDIQRIKTKLQQVGAAHAEPGALIIGIVWASSGLNSIKVEPKFGKFGTAYEIAEDWALVKLTARFKPQVQNTFDTNILRPDYTRLEDQAFIRVRPWNQQSGWSKLRVCKRGRTTDYTIGYVNGSRTVMVGKNDKGEAITTQEFSIVSTSTNGLFSMPGDSGSWIMDKQGQLVGMIRGKNVGAGTTIFTPAEYLFSWIKQHFEAEVKGKGKDSVAVRILAHAQP